MHKYFHHIGDFDKATRHLTRIERSVYRDMLDLYYETEQPLTLDINALCRKIIARSNEELTAVEQVLNEFFTKTERGWYQFRCEHEIEEYRNTKTQKSEAGKASAEARRLKKQQIINGTQTGTKQNLTAVEQPLKSVATEIQQPCNGKPTNQEPITNNQEPLQSIGENSIFTQPNEPVPAVSKKPKVDRGTRLPDDWEPSEKDLEWIKTNKPSMPAQQVADQTLAFKNYWTSKTGKDATKLDWSKTYQNWFLNLRTAGKYQPNQQPVTSRNVNDHWDSIPTSNQPLSGPPVEIPEGFV